MTKKKILNMDKVLSWGIAIASKQSGKCYNIKGLMIFSICMFSKCDLRAGKVFS